MRAVLHSLMLALTLSIATGPVHADAIRVAVASNFAPAIKALSQQFEQQTGHQVQLAFGSTGKQYAQIVHGAPFDAFFAADSKRPQLLEQRGIALPGSRFTYAIGKVVLWSPEPGRVDSQGQVLQQGDFRHLALANPKLAPYGKAAEQIMRGHGVWRTLRGQLVRGENIGQALQFVKSGNAELGFVAWAQLRQPGSTITGSFWQPPQSLYTPITQQAVLLNDNPVARQLLAFVRSDSARQLIQSYGYALP